MPKGVYIREIKSPLERFLSRITVEPNGCWGWKRGHSNGYASFHVTADRSINAHQFSYEYFVGPVPEGKELDHLCHNRGCVNPDHLEPVIHEVNCQRGDSGPLLKLKHQSTTHCPKGHPYDEKNTLMQRKKRDGPLLRVCKACLEERLKRKKWMRR